MQFRYDRRFVLGGLVGSAVSVSYARGPARAADLPAVTLNGAEVELRDAVIHRLAKRIEGRVLRPGDADYDGARRVWNAMFERRPALIVRCASVRDVQTAVGFAREHELLTAVRCGGHSSSGQSVCDRGLVIDLSSMRRVQVDPVARTVRADGGCLLGDLDAAAQAVGLASTFGVVSHTGVGGLTLGGGMGRLQRQFGLAIDNLREVQVVTADGRLLIANEQRNRDLFWAVRGGGGNFGIVTAFEFRLHPFSYPVTTRSFQYDTGDARKVLAAYFDYANEAPDELWLTTTLSRSASGDAIVSVSGNFMGAPDRAEPALRALGTFGKPIGTRSGSIKYLDIQKVADVGSRHGRYHYAKSGMLGSMADHGSRDRLIDATVGFFLDQALPGTKASLLLMGGAVNRVGVDATAYPHRSAMHNIDVGGDGDTRADGERYVDWGRRYWTNIEAFTGGGFYVNSSIDDDERRIRGNYGGNFERLVAVKTQYDPGNLFRLNANVRPRARG